MGDLCSRFVKVNVFSYERYFTRVLLHNTNVEPQNVGGMMCTEWYQLSIKAVHISSYK